jgi:hypothetical protein
MRCPRCKRDIRVRVDGRWYFHRTPPPGGAVCGASGLPVNRGAS